MAYDKSKNSDRPKRDYKPSGESGGGKKAFISKFKRKEGRPSGEDKPKSDAGKEERSAAPEPRKRITRTDDEKKPRFTRRTGPSSYSTGAERPKFTRKREDGNASSPGRKKFIRADEDKRKGLSKGPRKDFDKPFGRKGTGRPAGAEGKVFERPFGANRAFSAQKKYFKKKEEGPAVEGDAGKKSFSRDSQSPNRGRAKSFGAPSFGKPRKFSGGRRRDVMEESKFESKKSDGLIRLNKFISNSGVCSRREADELIKMGLISVNGKVITEMGHKVKPTDDVRHESKKLHAEKPVYILLNKPKGFITTTEDPQERKTVMSLIGGAVKERIYPVGRLDRNTTGLLLLTNDGDLADKLTHPSYKAKKIYKVELDKPLTKADFDRIMEGIRLEEGKAIVDDLAYVDDDKKSVGIELHIGWNRVVRRIFESLEYDVVKLDRVVYAGLDKKNLGRGEWRYLNPEEVVKMKHLNKG